MSMKKKIGITAGCVLVALVLAAFFLFLNEIRSLSSLTKLDAYPLYRMTYYGDYGFDDFLKVGAKNDGEIEDFVTHRLLKGLPIDLGVTGDACTAFVVRNPQGNVLFCRNFDFSYAPSLQMFTTPQNGYQSVSTVNLAFAGYSKEKLPDGGLNNFLTLASPYLPFDGVNEKGVAMALLTVPKVQTANDDSKVTLNTTTAIRLVLDKASNVNEAVELLRKYNIYFSGDVYCHFLIGDANGDSVLVEYWDGKLQTVKSTKKYQIASNFVAYNNLNIGEGFTEFARYDKVQQMIEENGGFLSEDQAIGLLREVGINNNGVDKLQWSVVYNLNTLEGKLFANRNTDNIIPFRLK